MSIAESISSVRPAEPVSIQRRSVRPATMSSRRKVMPQFRTRVAGVFTLVVSLYATPLATAQDEKPQEIPPILAINSAGLDAWLTSEKDRGLLELLQMIQPRLNEL